MQGSMLDDSASFKKDELKNDMAASLTVGRKSRRDNPKFAEFVKWDNMASKRKTIS